MTNKIRVCSLFSGIGGFEIGIYEALGKDNVEVVFASEIDKFASQSYEIYHGHKPHGDITKIDEKDIPDHDLLVGGFPCQAFSVAGRRLGFEDTRGTLFFDIARIIKEKKPKIFLLENVKGLLGHDKGQTMKVITETLSDLGYTIDFTILNSKFFGVPQSRERIFFVGVLGKEQEDWVIEKKATVLHKTKKMISEELNLKTFNFNFPEQKEVTTVLRDILEEEVDEKYYLSEEKTKRLLSKLDGEYKERTEKFLIDDQGRKNKDLKPLDISPTLRREMHGNEPRVVEKTEHNDDMKLLGMIDIKGNDSIRRVYDPSGVGPTLTTMGGGHREPKIAIEFDRRKGIGKELNVSHTISASDWRGLNRNQTQNAVLEAKDEIVETFSHRIRKLTPLECFRLQGFPNDLHKKLTEAGVSDTQLYKMAGNAVTANVVREVIKELVKHK